MYTYILRTMHTKPYRSAFVLPAISSKIYQSLPLTIDEAIAFRDAYYPEMTLEELYKDEGTGDILTDIETRQIMSNVSPRETYPGVRELALLHMRNTVINFANNDRAVMYAMGYGLALGRASGIREERNRRARIT